MCIVKTEGKGRKEGRGPITLSVPLFSGLMQERTNGQLVGQVRAEGERGGACSDKTCMTGDCTTFMEGQPFCTFSLLERIDLPFCWKNIRK